LQAKAQEISCVSYIAVGGDSETQGGKKLSGSPLFFAGNHRSPLFFAGKNKNKTREDTPGGRGTDGGSSIDINEPLSTGEEEVWSSSRIKIKRLTCDIT